MATTTTSDSLAAHAPAPTMRNVPFTPTPQPRVGIIGVGGRGSGLLGDLLGVENVRVVSVCDLVQEKAERAAKRVTEAGQSAPKIYAGKEDSYKSLLNAGDLDIVYIATPWDLHVPQAVYAMEHGIHAAVEVPVAVTLADCWRIVDVSEKTRKHCVILENCCYGYNELLVLNMVKTGLFGEITHGEAAYIHDLRALLFENSGEGLWRRTPHQTRNGNLYPTHGLGPVARYMGIHEGDRFTRLVSMSSAQRSLTEWRDTHLPEGDPKRRETYRCGDMNTSLIQTAQGRTVVLQHDVVTPRPYSRANLVAGTKGTFSDYPPRIYLDGQEGGEQWAGIDTFKEKYQHRLWRDIGELARKRGGHGGMDFLMTYRLMECLQKGVPPEMDVYDAAAWSAPGPLSDVSVAKGNAPVEFPDFTRGKWK